MCEGSYAINMIKMSFIRQNSSKTDQCSCIRSSVFMFHAPLRMTALRTSLRLSHPAVSGCTSS